MTIERIAIDPVKGREAWLALRQRDITASDVPAVCGEGLFGSPAKVWAEKRGLIGAAEMSEPMKRGIWGEAAVFEAIAWEYPDWEIRRAKVFLRDGSIGLGATPDGACIIPGRDGVGIIQAKVISLPVFQRDWIGEHDDIDDVATPVTPPLAYQLQTLTEGMLADAAYTIIAALVVDTFKWRLRIVFGERHAGAETMIREKVVHFRSAYLETGIQPAIDPTRDEELVRKLFPESNGMEVDLSADNELPELIDQMQAAKAEIKLQDEIVESAATAIKAKIGPHEAARVAGGGRLTHKTQNRKAYSVEATSFRVLRVSKGR